MTLKLNYSNRDPDAILADLRAKVPDLTDKWNDFLESDLGYALLQTFVAVSDRSSFYLDREAAEAFLATCERRDSAIAHAKPLGYTPISVSAATTSVSVSIVSSYFEDIHIPQGTILSIEDRSFHTTAPAVIPVGTTETTLACKQGSLFSVSQVSSGTQWHKITVPLNLADIKVYVDEVEWQKTSSFVRPVSRSSYRVYDDGNGKVVAFGSGATTLIPRTGAAIRVDGVTCNGFQGNTMYAGSPATILSPVYNSTMQNIVAILSAFAVSAASGGADAETIDSIKQNAPAVYTTQGRGVTADDYEFIVRALPGVSEATSWGGEEVGRYGEVFVCVSGVNPNEVPQSLINQVKAELSTKATIPMIVNVVPPVWVSVSLSVSVYVTYPYDVAATRSAVESAVIAFMNGLRIGQMLQASDLIAAATVVQGVDYVNLSATVSVDGLVSAGKARVRLINNYSENSLVLTRAGVTLWAYQNGGHSVRNGYLEVDLPAVSNGTVTLQMLSTKPDVYTYRDQKVRRGPLSVLAYRAGVTH